MKQATGKRIQRFRELLQDAVKGAKDYHWELADAIHWMSAHLPDIDEEAAELWEDLIFVTTENERQAEDADDDGDDGEEWEGRNNG